MECTVKTTGAVMKATLSGELDHHNAKAAREKIDREIDALRPTTLFLDFSGVGFMDSSGIGLVLGRCRKLEFYGGKVIVTGVGEQIYKVMKISGIEQIAEVQRSQK